MKPHLFRRETEDVIDQGGKPTSPLPQTPDEVRELVEKPHGGGYTENHLHSLSHFAYDMSKAWQAVGARAEALWKAAVIASYAPHE